MTRMNLFICFLCVCSDELKQQWETSVAQEKSAMERKQDEEKQVKVYKNVTSLSKGFLTFLLPFHCIV